MNTDSVSNQSDDISDVDLQGDALGEFVPRDAFRKLLGQRKKDKEVLKAIQEEKNSVALKARELEAKLQEVETLERTKQEDELRRRGELDKILAQRESEIANLKADQLRFQKELESEVKKQAFIEMLPAKLANREYDKFIPLESIKFDQNGEVNKKELERVVENWKKTHYRLLDMPLDTPKLPSDTASKANKLSYEEWINLPIKEKKKRIGDVIR